MIRDEILNKVYKATEELSKEIKKEERKRKLYGEEAEVLKRADEFIESLSRLFTAQKVYREGEK